MFTGEPMDAQEALRVGWATRFYPRDRLGEETEKLAQNIAGIPTDLIMFTKRSVNAQFEVMGFRNGLMWGSEILSLQNFRKSAGEFEKLAKKMGVKAAFKRRDMIRDR